MKLQSPAHVPHSSIIRWITISTSSQWLNIKPLAKKKRSTWELRKNTDSIFRTDKKTFRMRYLKNSSRPMRWTTSLRDSSSSPSIPDTRELLRMSPLSWVKPRVQRSPISSPIIRLQIKKFWRWRNCSQRLSLPKMAQTKDIWWNLSSKIWSSTLKSQPLAR